MFEHNVILLVAWNKTRPQSQQLKNFYLLLQMLNFHRENDKVAKKKIPW